ncbi:hypothetical protein P7K49_005394 [Saguinus oedipus]|uniref:Uncharacterized protein n=1 Tax=Saguinus oedipus TaxID=9490 RepID=A0ABQ9WDR6_SAGOE|nr:hypothetical protein P7K49_005394 [Saguinus oedipus]
MEYPAPGTVEAADGGGAGPYNSSKELERQEPDGVRFDRERARRLWEAVSVAQPVGREEGESEASEAGSPSRAHAARRERRKRGWHREPASGCTVTPPGPPPSVLRPGTPRLVLPIRALAPQESGPQRVDDEGPLTLRPWIFPLLRHHSSQRSFSQARGLSSLYSTFRRPTAFAVALPVSRVKCPSPLLDSSSSQSPDFPRRSLASLFSSPTLRGLWKAFSLPPEFLLFLMTEP